MSAVTLAISGDCMATRGCVISADPAARALQDLLRTADFAVTNLEMTPWSGQGYPVHNAVGGGGLIAGPDALDAVVDAGFSVLSGANNHALDLGVHGLLNTMDELRERGVPVAGVGPDLRAARRPVYVDRPQGSLALISCSSTFLPGQEAADPSPDLPGRPGLSPLRYSATVAVTSQQMAVLRQIDTDSGLRARRAEARTLLGLDPALQGKNRLALFGSRFEQRTEPGFETSCHPEDLEALAAWVVEARERADVVVVSVHSHEPGPTPEEPGEFVREFAHRMIDAGADVVMGHGPHFLRGVELYRGRPVFYSLGNIVSQIELSEFIPAEDYAKAPGSAALPGRYYSGRSGGGLRLFGPHRRYWQSVVPVLTFECGELTAVRLHPVDLGFGLPVAHRGRPRLASPERGQEILAEMSLLGKAYGTTVTVSADGVGEIATR